jgi:hypothetical protein
MQLGKGTPRLRYIFSSMGTLGSLLGTLLPSSRAWPAQGMMHVLEHACRLLTLTWALLAFTSH